VRSEIKFNEYLMQISATVKDVSKNPWSRATMRNKTFVNVCRKRVVDRQFHKNQDLRTVPIRMSHRDHALLPWEAVSNNVELRRTFLIYLLFVTTTLEDIFFETSGIFLLKKKQLGNSMKINKAINGLLTPRIVSFLKEFLCPSIFFCRQLAIFL
jgi:hypothetical protein